MSNTATQFEWAKNIPCRNIQIHGFCKWENKGCSFNHEHAGKSSQQQPPSEEPSPVAEIATPVSSATKTVDSSKPELTSSSSTTTSPLITNNLKSAITITSKTNPGVPIQLPGKITTPNTPSQMENLDPSKKRFNFDTPSFTPTGTLTQKFASLSPKLSDIPTFIPSAPSKNPTISNDNLATNIDNEPNSIPKASSSMLTFNPENTPVFTPGSSNFAASLTGTPLRPSSSGQPITPQTIAQPIQLPQPEEAFFQQTNLYPMNYHLYAPQPPPHIQQHLKPNERTVNDLFIPFNLRETIQSKNEASLKSVPITQTGLPLHVNQYHSLFPIDQNYEINTNSFGYRSSIYKVMSNTDGKLYAMRRLENVPITSEKCFKLISKWKLLDCANIVKLRDAFTTRAFGDNSLILIYDYFPMSFNLVETHFFTIGNRNPELITEELLWNYIVQLTNATYEVHKLNLSVGKFDPTKVILTNKGRVRLSSCGLLDIVKAATRNENEPVENIEELKLKDIKELAVLLLDLSKSTIYTKVQNMAPNEIINELKFSTSFKDALKYLFKESPDLEKFQQLIAPQIMKIMNGLQNSTDFMESCLSKEVENARLVRLLTKLDFICERAEFLKDGSWSETGDRYPIKLFKDYVFHQVDESGSPIIDLTHVVSCLNKLDAGIDENLLLVSPDENSCLIMSYRDLKELVDNSFRELRGQTLR